MYPDDNNDFLPANMAYTGGVSPYFTPLTDRGWLVGFMDFKALNLDNTNTSILLNPQYSQLAAYNKNAATYKCPADKSVINGVPRVRSMSMNCAVGTRWLPETQGSLPVTPTEVGLDNTAPYGVDKDWLTYGKYSTITKPGPADLWG